jgi:hypothetical protein
MVWLFHPSILKFVHGDCKLWKLLHMLLQITLIFCPDCSKLYLAYLIGFVLLSFLPQIFTWRILLSFLEGCVVWFLLAWGNIGMFDECARLMVTHDWKTLILWFLNVRSFWIGKLRFNTNQVESAWIYIHTLCLPRTQFWYPFGEIWFHRIRGMWISLMEDRVGENIWWTT